jgi:hypothetical protein
MKEIIYWNNSSMITRKAVVELCGWSNKKGTATPTGLRIAKTDYAQLTPAARRVLNNHCIKE